MPVLTPHLRFVDAFLERFSPAFTKKQMSIFKALVYGMFSDYKRLSPSVVADRMNIHYQKLRYFFGVLALDDAACPKPYAEKLKGRSFSAAALIKREENCNVAVASCFVSTSKHFPVNFKSYLPIGHIKEPGTFKSKPDMAKESIEEALAKGIPFSSVVVDRW